jgi:hypothetical protein
MFGADTLEVPCCDKPEPVLAGIRPYVKSDIDGTDLVTEDIGCRKCGAVYGTLVWRKP